APPPGGGGVWACLGATLTVRTLGSFPAASATAAVRSELPSSTRTSSQDGSALRASRTAATSSATFSSSLKRGTTTERRGGVTSGATGTCRALEGAVRPGRIRQQCAAILEAMQHWGRLTGGAAHGSCCDSTVVRSAAVRAGRLGPQPASRLCLQREAEAPPDDHPELRSREDHALPESPDRVSYRADHRAETRQARSQRRAERAGRDLPGLLEVPRAAGAADQAGHPDSLQAGRHGLCLGGLH